MNNFFWETISLLAIHTVVWIESKFLQKLCRPTSILIFSFIVSNVWKYNLSYCCSRPILSKGKSLAFLLGLGSRKVCIQIVKIALSLKVYSIPLVNLKNLFQRCLIPITNLNVFAYSMVLAACFDKAPWLWPKTAFKI